MEAAERGLRRLDGVVSAKAQGFRTPEKFYYDLRVREGKALTPAVVIALQKKLLEDYDYMDMMVLALPGVVEKAGGGHVLTVKGTAQKFALKAGGAHEKLLAEGKTRLAVTGQVSQPEKGDPVIEVAEAVEAKK